MNKEEEIEMLREALRDSHELLGELIPVLKYSTYITNKYAINAYSLIEEIRKLLRNDGKLI